MGFIKRMTKKEFEEFESFEDFEKSIKFAPRSVLEKMLIEELRDVSTSELKSMIFKIRQEKIEEYKRDMLDKMQQDIKSQLKLIEEGKFEKVVEFIKQTPEIYSGKFVAEAREVVLYAINKGDVQLVDYLLKRRQKIYLELSKEENYHLGRMGLCQSLLVEKLLELDASQGLDELAGQHIKSAVGGDYGDLICQSKENNAIFYYHTTESYFKMYESFKSKQQELQPK